MSTGVGYGPLVPPQKIRSRKGQLDLTKTTVCVRVVGYGS